MRLYLETLRGSCKCNVSFRGKKWDEALERPDLDYSEIFDEDVGQIPGLLYNLILVSQYKLCQ